MDVKIDPRVMPTAEGTKSDVEPASSPVVSEDVKPQTVEPEGAGKPQEKPTSRGDLTPDTRLYAALEEERRMRKELERQIKELKTPAPEYTDEGLVLKRNIDSLSQDLSSIKSNLELERVMAAYPGLKGVTEEFKNYLSEYPEIPMDKVAKLFLVEKGLTGETRKGLEKPSGGAKIPVPTLKEEDVKRLRENSPRQYLKMIREGKLDSIE